MFISYLKIIPKLYIRFSITIIGVIFNTINYNVLRFNSF
nr:MAG TPA: hypothetical protein [Crassvirales sp.]